MSKVWDYGEHGRGDLEAKDNGLNLEHLEFGVCVSH